MLDSLPAEGDLYTTNWCHFYTLLAWSQHHQNIAIKFVNNFEQCMSEYWAGVNIEHCGASVSKQYIAALNQGFTSEVSGHSAQAVAERKWHNNLKCSSATLNHLANKPQQTTSTLFSPGSC